MRNDELNNLAFRIFIAKMFETVTQTSQRKCHPKIVEHTSMATFFHYLQKVFLRRESIV